MKDKTTEQKLKAIGKKKKQRKQATKGAVDSNLAKKLDEIFAKKESDR